MENYAEQTLELVDNFISLARAEAMEMVLSPLALPDLLADCMDDAWASASKRSISLNLHDSELVWVNGNAPMLRRAFTNLIQNAIKYGPDGNQIDIELVLDKKQCGYSSRIRAGVFRSKIRQLFSSPITVPMRTPPVHLQVAGWGWLL